MNNEERNANSIVCESPLWATWVVIILGSETNLKRYPAVFLLSSNNIYILELCNFYCYKSENYHSQPETVLKLQMVLPADNVKYVVTGPYNNYLEIHYCNLEGIQKMVIWTGELQIQSLLNKLRSHYGFQIESKYTLEEICDLFQHSAILYDSMKGSTIARHFGAKLKVLACEAICLVQINHPEESKLWVKKENIMTFLIVTQSTILIMEESLISPLQGTMGQFKMQLSLEVNSCVKGIRMKDGGANHTCCPIQMLRDDGTALKENCFIHELYTCGYWLLIDFERNSSLKVRFFSREARSRFLEAFLASRNQKL